MDALVAFVLGALVGMTVYWLIYRIYWKRWRGYLERDKAYLQAKVESVQGTNFGLERQLSDQKAELGGLRAKVSDMERDNRHVEMRVEIINAEKQALIAHLDT